MVLPTVDERPYFPVTASSAPKTCRVPVNAQVTAPAPLPPRTAARVEPGRLVPAPPAPARPPAARAELPAPRKASPAAPPRATPPPVAAEGDASEEARATLRRELFERWSRPLLGIGFRAYVRGWIVACPHRLGYVCWGYAVLLSLAHLFHGDLGRPTTAFIMGAFLLAADRISLRQPWLRMLVHCVGVFVAVAVDAATRDTLFRSWGP